MKVCSICKQKKPYSEFYLNKLTKDTYGSQCKKCDTAEKKRLRREKKKRLVEYFGGKCTICGYNKYFGALDFHHFNQDKEFRISRGNLSFVRMLKEAKKCKLICATCHRETHGYTVLNR